MSSSRSLSPSANPGREPGSHRPPPVALVIDDDLGVRESLHVILEEDFEVLEAVNGAAGLEVLRSRRVDVALLDVRMPGERGPAVLPRILALDENIPVILITAMPEVRDAVECIKAGAYDYVVKPFDVEEILALVRQAATSGCSSARCATCARSWTVPMASTSWWAATPRWCASTS